MKIDRFLIVLIPVLLLLGISSWSSCTSKAPSEDPQNTGTESPAAGESDPQGSTDPASSEGTGAVTDQPSSPEDEKKGQTVPKSGQSEKGVLLYAIPDSMKVGRVKIVEVRISRSRQVANLRRLKSRIRPEVNAKTDTILTGEIMDIELSEHDTANAKFRIIPRQASEQILKKDDIAYWAWSVIPLKAGRHALIVRAGIKQYSAKFQEKGYRYIPVYEQEVLVESSGTTVAGNRPADIPPSYDDKPAAGKRLNSDPSGNKQPGKNQPWLPWLLALSAGGAVLLIVILLITRRKSAPLVKPPPIPRERLNAIDELIKKDKLEKALDVLEELVKVVRDKEHNQLISYEAELEGFEKKYKSGEIKYEEYARVRARIRRALIEMNDRLMEG